VSTAILCDSAVIVQEVCASEVHQRTVIHRREVVDVTVGAVRMSRLIIEFITPWRPLAVVNVLLGITHLESFLEKTKQRNIIS